MDERQPLLDPPANGSSEVQNNGKLNVVEFDRNGDPDDPMQWPKRYRWSIVLLLTLMAFTVTFTCIGIVPVAGDVVRELEGHKDRSASVLFVTIWELGEAAGPLFIAPLSEIYGRYAVVNGTNAMLIMGIIITALSQDMKLLIFARFLTGCAVHSNVLNPAIVGDMFESESRGSPMSAIFLAPLVGGAVGPAAAGAIAQATGWREVMWIALALAGFCEIVFLTLFRETYKVTILRRRAARLRKETGNHALKTEYDEDEGGKLMIMAKCMLTPAKILFSSTILQLLSLWGALVFSFFYIMSTTLPEMLQEVYGFNAAQTGVSFLSFSVGSISGIGICNLLVDRIFIKYKERNKGKIFPEGRLPLVILGAFMLPVVVLLYGWAPGLHWHFSVLLVATILLGFAIIFSIVPMMTYVTDIFGVSSASALTAVLITRCLAGTFLPLATAPLTDRLGYGLGYTILAAACLVLAPVPVLVMRYGSRWRQWSGYTRDD